MQMSVAPFLNSLTFSAVIAVARVISSNFTRYALDLR